MIEVVVHEVLSDEGRHLLKVIIFRLLLALLSYRIALLRRFCTTCRSDCLLFVSAIHLYKPNAFSYLRLLSRGKRGPRGIRWTDRRVCHLLQWLASC
jgi:hypothetical protein